MPYDPGTTVHIDFRYCRLMLFALKLFDLGLYLMSNSEPDNSSIHCCNYGELIPDVAFGPNKGGILAVYLLHKHKNSINGMTQGLLLQALIILCTGGLQQGVKTPAMQRKCGFKNIHS